MKLHSLTFLCCCLLMLLIGSSAIVHAQNGAGDDEAARKPEVSIATTDARSAALTLRGVQVTGNRVQPPQRTVSIPAPSARSLPDRTPLFVVDGVIVRDAALNLNSLHLERGHQETHTISHDARGNVPVRLLPRRR
jgi:hypothetical protein